MTSNGDKDDFPYYRQETDFTCGPACLRMVLERFGVRKTEKQLAGLLETTKKEGTLNKAFPVVAKKLKLNYVANGNSSIKELKEKLEECYSIIVCFYYKPERVYHYAVVKAISQKTISFWDPLTGPSKSCSVEEFKEVWRSHPKQDRQKRWFIALKKGKAAQ